MVFATRLKKIVIFCRIITFQNVLMNRNEIQFYKNLVLLTLEINPYIVVDHGII